MKELVLCNAQKFPLRGYKAIQIFSVAVVFLSLIFLADYASTLDAGQVKETEKLLSFIRENIPEESKVYTILNTGGVMEFLGRKIYIDARPELYSKEIIKSSENIIKEWNDLEWNDIDSIPEYVSSHDWEYYFVSKGTPIQFYLQYSNVAECMYSSQNNCIYKRLFGGDGGL